MKTKLENPSKITFEGPDTVRKRGDEYRLRREQEAMQFVRTRTSIPVFQVLDSHLEPDGDREQSWLIMERLSGIRLGITWPSMTKAAQSNTHGELKSYLEELHSILPPDPGWIGSCSHGPAYDHRIDNRKTCGPWSSVSEFHDFLVAPMKGSPRPEWAIKYRNGLPDTHTLCFTHADISEENILTEPDTGKVTAILDWEMAGFWPDWWEYRKALFGSRPQLWWYAVLKDVMHEYHDETEADMDIEIY